MQYGLTFPWVDPRTFAELAHEAEAIGWDGVFYWDGISIHELPIYDPWVALAGAAMRTERVRLGTMLTPLSRRRPWKLARETVTLDHLSNGRLVLGVGLGGFGEMSFTHFGEVTDGRQRAQMLDESLDILAGLWSGEPFSYRGKHYS